MEKFGNVVYVQGTFSEHFKGSLLIDLGVDVRKCCTIHFREFAYYRLIRLDPISIFKLFTSSLQRSNSK